MLHKEAQLSRLRENMLMVLMGQGPLISIVNFVCPRYIMRACVRAGGNVRQDGNSGCVCRVSVDTV